MLTPLSLFRDFLSQGLSLPLVLLSEGLSNHVDDSCGNSYRPPKSDPKVSSSTFEISALSLCSAMFKRMLDHRGATE